MLVYNVFVNEFNDIFGVFLNKGLTSAYQVKWSIATIKNFFWPFSNVTCLVSNKTNSNKYCVSTGFKGKFIIVLINWNKNLNV